ncbi:MAG: hypothetical protein ACLUT5_12590 [Butyricicoccus sp.]
MAAADKLNGAYWRKRAIELAEKQKQEDDDLCLRFHREYERILHELDKELSIFYARYAANESVSMADARRLLRDAELEDFRMSLDEFGIRRLQAVLTRNWRRFISGRVFRACRRCRRKSNCG